MADKKPYKGKEYFNSGVQVGGYDKLNDNSKGFVDRLVEKFGPDELVFTSGYRKGEGKSHHHRGDALDIRPNPKLWNYLVNNPEGIKLMNEYGFNILDESDPAMLKKTGGTGPHFHIGKDVSQSVVNTKSRLEHMNSNKGKIPIIKPYVQHYEERTGTKFDYTKPVRYEKEIQVGNERTFGLAANPNYEYTKTDVGFSKRKIGESRWYPVDSNQVEKVEYQYEEEEGGDYYNSMYGVGDDDHSDHDHDQDDDQDETGEDTQHNDSELYQNMQKEIDILKEEREKTEAEKELQDEEDAYMEEQQELMNRRQKYIEDQQSVSIGEQSELATSRQPQKQRSDRPGSEILGQEISTPEFIYSLDQQTTPEFDKGGTFKYSGNKDFEYQKTDKGFQKRKVGETRWYSVDKEQEGKIAQASAMHEYKNRDLQDNTPNLGKDATSTTKTSMPKVNSFFEDNDAKKRKIDYLVASGEAANYLGDKGLTDKEDIRTALVNRVESDPNWEKSIDKDLQKKFESRQWENYDNMTTTGKVMDRVNSAVSMPLTMGAKLLSGDQAYFPGQHKALGENADPRLRKAANLDSYGTTGFAENFNPGTWGMQAGMKVADGDNTGYGDLAVGILGNVIGGPLVNTKSIAKGVTNVTEDVMNKVDKLGEKIVSKNNLTTRSTVKQGNMYDDLLPTTRSTITENPGQIFGTQNLTPDIARYNKDIVREATLFEGKEQIKEFRQGGTTGAVTWEGFKNKYGKPTPLPEFADGGLAGGCPEGYSKGPSGDCVPNAPEGMERNPHYERQMKEYESTLDYSGAVAKIPRTREEGQAFQDRLSMGNWQNPEEDWLRTMKIDKSFTDGTDGSWTWETYQKPDEFIPKPITYSQVPYIGSDGKKRMINVQSSRNLSNRTNDTEWRGFDYSELPEDMLDIMKTYEREDLPEASRRRLEGIFSPYFSKLNEEHLARGAAGESEEMPPPIPGLTLEGSDTPVDTEEVEEMEGDMSTKFYYRSQDVYDRKANPNYPIYSRETPYAVRQNGEKIPFEFKKSIDIEDLEEFDRTYQDQFSDYETDDTQEGRDMITRNRAYINSPNPRLNKNPINHKSNMSDKAQAKEEATVARIKAEKEAIAMALRADSIQRRTGAEGTATTTGAEKSKPDTKAQIRRKLKVSPKYK